MPEIATPWTLVPPMLELLPGSLRGQQFDIVGVSHASSESVRLTTEAITAVQQASRIKVKPIDRESMMR